VANYTAVRMDYLPLLKFVLLKPLVAFGQDAIQQSLTIMHDYFLCNEDLKLLSDVASYRTQATWNMDLYKQIDSKVMKALFKRYKSDYSKSEIKSPQDDLESTICEVKNMSDNPADKVEWDLSPLRNKCKKKSAPDEFKDSCEIIEKYPKNDLAALRGDN